MLQEMLSEGISDHQFVIISRETAVDEKSLASLEGLFADFLFKWPEVKDVFGHDLAQDLSSNDSEGCDTKDQHDAAHVSVDVVMDTVELPAKHDLISEHEPDDPIDVEGQYEVVLLW